MGTMRISELSGRTGVPATTLRYYEDAGLLRADRTAAGYRSYGQGAVERLAFIGAAKNLGLSLEEIGELLPVWQDGACVQVKGDLRPRVEGRLAQALARRAELGGFIASLRGALHRLDELPDRPGRCDPECGFLASAPDAGARIELPLVANHRAAQRDTDRWRTAPVACSLTDEDIGERTGRWRAVLADGERRPIDEGIEVTVPADRAADIAELAVAEQRCCPFLDFRLHLDGPVLRLEVRAPDDGAYLLTRLFGVVQSGRTAATQEGCRSCS